MAVIQLLNLHLQAGHLFPIKLLLFREQTFMLPFEGGDLLPQDFDALLQLLQFRL